MPDAAALPRSQRLAVGCATVCGIGRLRPGPGTWASIVAGLSAWPAIVLLPTTMLTVVLLVAVAAVTLVGWWSAPAAMRHFASGDPGPVVIDEVAGTWLTIALVPASTLASAPLTSVLLAVLLFRVFDIAKPWPVGWFERLPGAVGIMADDLAAGAIAGILAAAILH
ncbi:MAG: phosphatidylglycerophosphatase A [Planctomycetes bacterium]|nr:phosphatidylglycerophosphatase A [Planctomycetota bacterium]